MRLVSPRLILACAVAVLAVPGPARADGPLYVTDSTANTVDRFTVESDGNLNYAASIPGPAADGEQIAPLADGSGLFVGQVPGPATADLRAYTVTASGALVAAAPANSTNPVDDAAGIAAHPVLDVVYFVSDLDDALYWRRVQPGGGIFSNASGQGGFVLPLGTSQQDVIVDPGGAYVYVAYSDSVHVYPLAADGSIVDDKIEELSGQTSVKSLAITPDGENLYYVANPPVPDASWDIVHCQLGADGSFGTCTTNPTGSVPEKLIVSPDGQNLYVSQQDGGVRVWTIAESGAISLVESQDDNVSVNLGGGLAVTLDGRYLFVAHQNGDTLGNGAIVEFTRDAQTGAITPKIESGSNATAKARKDTIDLTTPYEVIDIALRPHQGPTASFTVNPATAGSPTQFNAGASSDPDGAIARYDWNFGDGATLANGGPTPTHVYPNAGTFSARVTVTDSDGISTQRIHTGHYTLANGGPAATTTRSVQIAQPQPQPQPQQPPPPKPPPPEPNESIQVAPAQGEILVKVPGSNEFVPLESLTNIPEGSIIDAREGRVVVTSAADNIGKTQTATFYAGLFKVNYVRDTVGAAQRRRRVLLTEAILQGKIGPCARRARKSDAAAAARRKRRRLWGNGRGNFRTRGRRSSATVRGTIWRVEDACDGTRTFVRRGVVEVDDFGRRRNVILKKGKRYLARSKRSR